MQLLAWIGTVIEIINLMALTQVKRYSKRDRWVHNSLLKLG